MYGILWDISVKDTFTAAHLFSGEPLTVLIFCPLLVFVSAGKSIKAPSLFLLRKCQRYAWLGLNKAEVKTGKKCYYRPSFSLLLRQDKPRAPTLTFSLKRRLRRENLKALAGMTAQKKRTALKPSSFSVIMD